MRSQRYKTNLQAAQPKVRQSKKEEKENKL
jgi:hypothetical protein